MFSVLRLTAAGAARSVLLQFEPKYGRPGDGKQACLALQSKYQNNSPQRRRTLLRCLDDSGIKPDIDPHVFLSEINQIRDELGVLDATVSTERLTTIILDALLAEIYSTVKFEAIRDLDLMLEQMREISRESAMLTALITCHYCKKTGHKVRDCW